MTGGRGDSDVEILAALDFPTPPTGCTIVDRTRSSADVVHRALATSRSQLAKATVAKYDLTLDQAAAVAEFEDDTEVVKELVVTARERPEYFAHALQRRRDDRARKTKVAELYADIPAVEPPSYGTTTPKACRLSELKDPGTESRKAITAAKHKKCPGHAAYVASNWQTPEIVYVCADWRANGHKLLYGNDTAGASADTPEAKAAASAERKQVIENNKAWRSAETVRRAWLKTFLTAKTPPKGTASYLATELADSAYEVDLRDSKSSGLAVSMLGADAGGSGGSGLIAALVSRSTEQRSQVIALGLVLCAAEASTDVQTWRRRSDAHQRYFTFLGAHGYALSDVEQLVIKPRKRSRAQG